jgi:hypothetical protein
MRRRSIAIALVASCVLSLTAAALAADDPFIGTWKLNIGKSTLFGLTPPQSLTLVIKAIDNGLQEISDTVNAGGQANHRDQAYIADGKDHPVTGNPNLDAYNLKRMDPLTTVFVTKKAAKEVTVWRNTISNNGKTLIRAMIQGQNSGRTMVFDKQ